MKIWLVNIVVFVSFPLLSNITHLSQQNVSLDCLTRPSSKPYISGDTFRSIANHIIDETCTSCSVDSIKQGDIIFLKVDYLEPFFSKVHATIAQPYILITHNGDRSAPGGYAHYLKDPKLIAWFGQNSDIAYHPKFFPIPIGIANSQWRHGKVATFNAAQIYAAQKPAKKYLFYLNFADSTHSERGGVREFFEHTTFATVQRSKPHQEYLKDLAHAKFVACPRGNGLDCHRTWEALLMGAIPVVKHSPLDPLFEGLPVLLIHDWREVTQEFLERTYKKMQSQKYARERMYAQYWLDKILEVQRTARASS